MATELVDVLAEGAGVRLEHAEQLPLSAPHGQVVQRRPALSVGGVEDQRVEMPLVLDVVARALDGPLHFLERLFEHQSIPA